MKYLAALALLVSYASAECNNMCSGHGVCGANDMCTCYRNWRGNDCSEQTCQFGVAFIDTPFGDLDHDGYVSKAADTAGAVGWTNWNKNVITQWAASGAPESFVSFAAQEAHGYMECSNKGICDRASGDCVCFDGYEGSACQRTVCPNACSGNGVCRNIVDISNSLSSTAKESYPLWDGLKNQHCVCDPGFSGNDCSLRLCPVNADPLKIWSQVNNQAQALLVYQKQAISITTASVTSFTFTYTDYFGETWTSQGVTVDQTPVTPVVANTAASLKAAFDAIPNGATVGTSVSCSGTTTQVCTVSFTAQAGSLNLVAIAATTPAAGISAITVAVSTPATNAAEECSSRGICDYSTGLCKCFRGYRTADCSQQHALAY